MLPCMDNRALQHPPEMVRSSSLQTERNLAQMRTLTEKVPGLAFFSLDPHGRVETWNLGAQQIFGYSESEIIGRPVHVLFTREDQASGAADREIRRAAETGVSLDERWHQRKDHTQ